jgi:hypothetical protein
MNRIKRFLFNFDRAYAYTFVAGILVTFAINLLTTALLTQSLPICVYKVYGASFFLLISAICSFAVGAVLDKARSEWQSVGSPKDEVVIREDYVEKGRRIKRLWSFFLSTIVGFILSMFLLLV